jgi:hypothetical protein
VGREVRSSFVILHCHWSKTCVCVIHKLIISLTSMPSQFQMKLSWKWVFQAGRQFIYLHPKHFGALGYISDGNRNAEGLLMTADNGEHIDSMKSSRSNSHVKMWRSAYVSGTDSVPISRVLLVVWLYQTISKCAARTHWFFPIKFSAINTRWVAVHYSRGSYEIVLFWSHVSMCQ